MKNATHFNLIVFQDPTNGIWLGSVEEIPGVYASGYSEEEVLAKLPSRISRMVMFHLKDQKPVEKPQNYLDNLCQIFQSSGHSIKRAAQKHYQLTV